MFSRQRYWGEPFPIWHELDADGNPTGLMRAETSESLPVLHPHMDDFKPTGSPDPMLAKAPTDWLYKTDTDGTKLKRETNSMPQWAGSCWYFLRFCDNKNSEAFIDPALEKYWMPVDLYIGGAEHAVLHLLYSRFWHKVLYDLGHLSSIEPYARLYNQGYIQAAAFKDEREIYVEAAEVEGNADDGWTHNGEPVTREYGKMGKSLKNAVSPDEMYEAYGADTLRLYEMTGGPLDSSRPWETRDVVGMYRFLQRLWRNVVDEETGECTVVDTPADEDTLKLLHRTVDFNQRAVGQTRADSNSLGLVIGADDEHRHAFGPQHQGIAGNGQNLARC